MIRGVVSAHREAIIKLRIRGSGGIERLVDVVVDSGFSASLALPPTTVAALGLARQMNGRLVLADGSVRSVDLCAAEVEWDGAWRPVLVSAIGYQALLGTRLLAQHELRIAVAPGGVVEISALP
jgi:clan AA aspartic protease